MMYYRTSNQDKQDFIKNIENFIYGDCLTKCLRAKVKVSMTHVKKGVDELLNDIDRFTTSTTKSVELHRAKLVIGLDKNLYYCLYVTEHSIYNMSMSHCKSFRVNE